MKPTAAFAAGLWTGAVVMAAVGFFYLRVWDLGRPGSGPAGGDKLESRIQLLQQEQSRAQAEEARLRQTVADLQSELATRLAMEERHEQRLARREATTPEPPVESWIIETVVKGDTQALSRLARAALADNLPALDALALLADLDNGYTLDLVWNSPQLSTAGRERAAFLLAATAEVNPNAATLLQKLFATPGLDPQLSAAAIAGIETPNFKTRLNQSPDFPAPPHFRPDYTQRAWMVQTWRAVVTDPQLAATLDRVRDRLAQRASEPRGPE
jgi:hypothetical protein